MDCDAKTAEKDECCNKTASTVIETSIKAEVIIQFYIC